MNGVIAWVSRPILFASQEEHQFTYVAKRDAILGRFILPDAMLVRQIVTPLGAPLIYCEREDEDMTTYGAPAEAIRRLNFSLPVRAGMPVNVLAFNPLLSAFWGRLVIEAVPVGS